MASNTNIGNQSVSIYPYQNLDSILGNQILLGIMKPGVYNCSVSITKTGDVLSFTVSAGSTFIFNRQGTPDNTNDSQSFLGKIVLNDDYVLTKNSSVIEAFTDNTKFYVTAEWTYDKIYSSDKYLKIDVKQDLPNIDTSTSDHYLCLASVLNVSAYKDANTQPSLLKVAYDEQESQFYLNPLYERAKTFPIIFHADGLGISVGAGEIFVGGKLFTINNSDYPTPQLPDKMLISYNYDTGVETDVVEANYYQVNFLRIKRNATTNTVGLGWDSFAFLKGDATIADLDEVKDFVIAQDFRLKDEGFILAINVTDYTNRQIWTDNTIIMYQNKEILSTMSTAYSDRSSISVYDEIDVVGLGNED